MPKISVIVPVYNVAPYLKECVDSIMNQTLTDIEIILVDDGSTDESGAMCDRYAKEDGRIRVIHKKNGGLSDARNAGLKICQGEFIGFVDGDDYVDRFMYEVLYNRAVQMQADVSGCLYIDVYNDRVIKSLGENFCSNNKDEIISYIFQGNGGQISVCNKIFRKYIFDDLRFDTGKYYEDAYIVLKWIEKTGCFTCINKGYYYYIHRTDSITGEAYSDKVLDIISAYKYNLAIIKEKYPRMINYGERRLWWAYRLVIERMYLSGKDSRFLKNIIRNNIWRILNNPAISIKAKMAYCMLSINTQIYMKLKELI